MTTGAYDPTRFYVWQAPGKTVSIHLSLEVVERLIKQQFDVARTDPPQDISGVLLGHTLSGPHPASLVEDFVLENRTEKNEGFLSSHDDVFTDMICKLVQGAGSGRHVIGFVRSQSDGALIPNELDFTNAVRLLGEPDNVLLLIRFSQQGGSEANFFYWEDGTAQFQAPGPPFSFDVAKISVATPVVRTHPEPQLRNAALSPPPALAQLSPGTGVWWKLLPTFALFAIVTVGIQMFGPSDSSKAKSTAEVAAGDESPLGLKVTARSDQLEIRWNHDSTRILAAEKAEIRITEGDVTEVMPLVRQDLLDGYVAYAPQTKDVNVRFEVSGPGGHKTAESVRVVDKP
jgi:hypothetical protein